MPLKLRFDALDPWPRRTSRARPKTAGSIVAIGLAVATAFLASAYPETGIAASRTRQIKIEYAAPQNPAHQAIYEKLKDARVLEYIQDVLGVIRLPRPLTIRLAGCDGISNAWYGADEITVCYEYVDEIYKNAAEGNLPVGITRQDTIVGPLADVFLHEGGHAIFEYLRVPIFGREEDAADQFSSYIILQHDKERARGAILGSAYQYRLDVKQSQIALPTTKFSDGHGHPAQRFFNVLCIAYGSDPKLYSDLVTKGLLPQDRADQCPVEYEQTAFAFKTLIGPHIDRVAAKRALKRRHKGKNAL